MPWFNGYPFTSFKGVNVKNGVLRFQDGEGSLYGARIEVDSSSLTADRKVYLADGAGTMMVRGYHVTYGSATFQRSAAQAADTLYTGTAAITGLLTTSILFVNFAGMSGTGAATGPLPIGAACTTAGIADLMLLNLAATTTIGTSVVNYLLLHPQTS